MPVSVWVWTPIDFIRESYTKRLDTVLVSLIGYGIFLLAPIFYFRVTDSASPLESEGLSPEELNMTYQMYSHQKHRFAGMGLQDHQANLPSVSHGRQKAVGTLPAIHAPKVHEISSLMISPLQQRGSL